MSTSVSIRRATERVRNSPKASRLRADIQGLRAFAVVVVILDHLLGWPSGGFVGVDIFFVISGFVITQSLLREQAKTGRISITGFYRRRIKRILPASLATLLLTVVAAYFIFSQSRFMTTMWDAVWAMFFAANIRMDSVGTDYFQSSGPVSPLQHFWSLAVEEQFYFVWPFMMIAAFFLFPGKGTSSRGGRVAAGVLIGAICAGSFLWALAETANHPTSAYFSTFARAWELGIGALLAVAATVLAGIPAWLRPALAWLGVAGMVASLFVINTATPFPAPSAALPVLSAALYILAGTGATTHRFLSPFTNRVSNYLGDISYSLYLIHFPVIILAGTFWDVHEPVPAVLTLVGIVATAMYSYHLLEDPIRKSAWLEGKALAKGGARADLSPTFKMTALSLLAVVAVGLSFAAIQSQARTSGSVTAAQLTPRTPEATASANVPAFGQAGQQIQSQVAAALATTEWPELTPSLDEVIAGPQVPADVARCGGIASVDESECSWGDASATKNAVIIGDSVALTYVAALRDVFQDKPDWKLSTYAAFGCTFTAAKIDNADTKIVEGCPAKKDEAVAAINSMQPDIVFITNTYEPRTDLQTKTALTPSQWQQSTQKFVDSFKGAAKKVVFLAPPPSDVDIKACFSRVSVPADCNSKVTGQWFSMASAEGEMARTSGGVWLDSSRLFCSEGSCPSFVGKTPTKMDKVHMTEDYAHMIAPALAEELERLQVL